MKRLFVSSTFKDMQYERDLIKIHVVPELNARIKDYGEKVTQLDLRWGISTSELSAEEGEQKVLNVCLEEINKSRPYMIVIIGERYGWMPSPALIEINAKNKGIKLETNEISVTQLEIEYIAFTEKWDESRIFFYFRDFDYGEMDKEQRAIYESESPNAREKLSALKKRIEKKFPRQIRTYKLRYKNGEIEGFKEFEQLVLNDLYNLFNRDLKSEEEIDVNIRIRDKLHAEAMDNYKFYLKEYDAFKHIYNAQWVENNGRYRYIAGSPRCGKSFSVLSHYAALYAFKNQNEPCWQHYAPQFEDKVSVLGEGKSVYKWWLDGVAVEKTYPLYLKMGYNKDIKDDIAMLRIFLYFLNLHLGIKEVIPTDRENLIADLGRSLKKLSKSDKSFFLFLDDLTAEGLSDLFELEHLFNEKEVLELLDHFYFYIAFDNKFHTVPVYVPFYNKSVLSTAENYYDMPNPSEYFHISTKKIGKELSLGVNEYIGFHFSGYGHSITKTHADLAVNYFTNFTSDDYRNIRALGNDMRAIERKQLNLLEEVRGSLSDDSASLYEDKKEKQLKNIINLNLNKFSANHSKETMKMLGIIYLLTGIRFSMREAEYIYSFFGVEWNELEFVSYFDDFKAFYAYSNEDDSYMVISLFHTILRKYTIKNYLPQDDELAEVTQKLIAAVKASPFYESKKQFLSTAFLLTPDYLFVKDCFLEFTEQFEDKYLAGKSLGKSVVGILKIVSGHEVSALGITLAPLLLLYSSHELIDGFFDGIGYMFQEHDFEGVIAKFTDALIEAFDLAEGDKIGTYYVRVMLTKAYCYLGWKNNKALNFLYNAEEYLEQADAASAIRYIAVLITFLPKFKKASPTHERLKGIVKRWLPEKDKICFRNGTETAVNADLFTIAYYVKQNMPEEEFCNPNELLDDFLKNHSIAELGLWNIDTFITSLDATKKGLQYLIACTRDIMESLSINYHSDRYASRLISNCMLARLLYIDGIFNKGERVSSEMEKYYYPYKKAVLNSADRTSYHYINYARFLNNSRCFHNKTGISHEFDEEFWEVAKLGRWSDDLYYWLKEESIDTIIEICYAYITYVGYFKNSDFIFDMISMDAAKEYYKYGEEGSEEPSLKAMHYRLTVFLAAVIHNPNSRIMKSKLKKTFNYLREYYGDYINDLSNKRYNRLVEYIENL